MNQEQRALIKQSADIAERALSMIKDAYQRCPGHENFEDVYQPIRDGFYSVERGLLEARKMLKESDGEDQGSSIPENLKRQYEADLLRKVYEASLGLFTRLEVRDAVLGDSHELARELAETAVDFLKNKWAPKEKDGEARAIKHTSMECCASTKK